MKETGKKLEKQKGRKKQIRTEGREEIRNAERQS
jgi:hypothetical protein